MDVNRSLVDVDAVAPNAVKQLLSRKDPAGGEHQEFEQAVFRWTKPNAPALPEDLVLLTVEEKLSHRKNMGQHGRISTAQYGSDSGK